MTSIVLDIILNSVSVDICLYTENNFFITKVCLSSLFINEDELLGNMLGTTADTSPFSYYQTFFALLTQKVYNLESELYYSILSNSEKTYTKLRQAHF